MGLLGRVVTHLISRAVGGNNDPGIFSAGFDRIASSLGGKRRTRDWLEKYGTNGTLQAIVRRVACDVAMVKWRVYRELPGEAGPNGPKLKRLIGHPLEQLWLKPCPALVGYQWRYLLQVYLEMDGEAMIVLERDPGSLVPKAMWPIPSTWVSHRPTPAQPYWTVNLGSGVHHLPAGEIVWLHDPDPVDPYGRGLGVARSLDDEVQQEEWMCKFNNAFFRNGAHPHQVFALEGVEPAQARQLKEDYEKKYSGFWAAFKTAWLSAPKGGSVKVHSTASSHRDMDFVEGRKAGRDNLMMGWNMPRFELGISEDVNRASAQASDYTKSKNVTLPRIVYLEEAWACWLVPLFQDPLLRLVPDNPVKQTEEFILLKATEGWISGALKRNEWRVANGWDPLADDRGEVILEPLNMSPEQVGDRRVSLLDQLRQRDPDGAAVLEQTWRRLHGSLN